MFRKIDQRENVFGYRLSSAGVLVVDRQFKLFQDQKLIADGVDPLQVTVYADQYLVYLLNTGQTVVQDFRQGEPVKAAVAPMVNTISGGTIVGYTDVQFNYDTMTAEHGVYAFPSLTLLHKLPVQEIEHYYRSGDYLIYGLRGILHCLNLDSQELVWSVEVGSIKQILGIIDGVLWLEGKLTVAHSVMRGFELATGVPVHLSEKVDLPVQPVVTLTPDGRSVFIVGRSAAFEHAAYIEIDLGTRSVKRRGGLTSASVPGATLALYEYTLAGDFLYGTAGLNGSSWPTALCVLNYQTLKTEWWQPLESVPGAFLGASHAPQVGDNVFFILDTEGFLHQYQRV